MLLKKDFTVNMKDFIRREKLKIIFTFAGGIGGFLYWRFVGCNSGTCPIQSVWYWSTLWGAALGYLAGDFIKDIFKKRKKNSNAER